MLTGDTRGACSVEGTCIGEDRGVFTPPSAFHCSQQFSLTLTTPLLPGAVPGSCFSALTSLLCQCSQAPSHTPSTHLCPADTSCLNGIVGGHLCGRSFSGAGQTHPDEAEEVMLELSIVSVPFTNKKQSFSFPPAAIRKLK